MPKLICTLETGDVLLLPRSTVTKRKKT